MQKPIVPPEDCRDMTDVRHGVDTLDQALLRLLAKRFGYMDAAARIKPARGAVRDQARKDDVHAKVAAGAEALGLPAERLRAVWEELMEQSIAYEFERWDDTRG
ncbi:MAG: chorismate mutase [Sphingomonadales bacterium]|nr:chorismate mutase [Sphingomonadales bacterium]